MAQRLSGSLLWCATAIHCLAPPVTLVTMPFHVSGSQQDAGQQLHNGCYAVHITQGHVILSGMFTRVGGRGLC
jgi:hypothetical protein